MKILTDSINNYLYSTFNKDSSDILISDALLVEYLTIDGFWNNTNSKVSFKDLKNFKNLKYLEIANVVINKPIIDILADLDYISSIVFRNCDFNVKDMSKLKKVNNIRIINCNHFDISCLKKLDNLKRLYISGDIFENLTKFDSFILDVLDISGCSLETSAGFDKVNTNYFVISSKQYNDFQDKILNLTMKIMVMADPSYGYYIEKWIN